MMQVKGIEFTDPQTNTGTRSSALQITCGCGCSMIVKGFIEVFPDLMALVDSHIRYCTSEAKSYRRDCPGKQRARERLAMWERVLESLKLKETKQ